MSTQLEQRFVVSAPGAILSAAYISEHVVAVGVGFCAVIIATLSNFDSGGSSLKKIWGTPPPPRQGLWLCLQ